MTVLIVVGFMLVSCICVACILSCCKKIILKSPETTVNTTNSSRNRRNNEFRSRRPNSIFVVPTTNQVMEMYLTQASASASESVNNLYETTTNSVRKPPSYGTAIIDLPPSYDQAVAKLDSEAK